MTLHKLRGYLALTEDYNGHQTLWCGDDIVSEWADDIMPYRKQVSIRYWTSEKELDDDAIKQKAVEEILGLIDAKYRARFSEVTGYLWTDENFKVGGHDMLARLTSEIPRFLLLEMTVHEYKENGSR
jgi:hypothetical protein